VQNKNPIFGSESLDHLFWNSQLRPSQNPSLENLKEVEEGEEERKNIDFGAFKRTKFLRKKHSEEKNGSLPQVEERSTPENALKQLLKRVQENKPFVHSSYEEETPF